MRLLTNQSTGKRSEQQRQIKNHVQEGITRTTEEIMALFPSNIDEKSFEHAKSVLDRFTVVLDIACLDDGMEALAGMIGLDYHPLDNIDRRKANKRKSSQGTPKERIGHDDVYEYLREKNRWDIALYEYSKNISMVRC